MRKGVPLGTPAPATLLYTDASLEEWGAHARQWKISGLWNRREKKLHINVLEMIAVYLAFSALARQLNTHTILIMSDNSSVISHLNKQGGTKSHLLCHWT